VVGLLLGVVLPAAGLSREKAEFSIAGGCHESLVSLMSSDLEGAEARARELVAAGPEDPFCAAAMGEIFLMKGSHFWAISHLRRAGELAEAAGAPESLGTGIARLLCIALTGSKQWEAALEVCARTARSGGQADPLAGYYAGVSAFRSDDERAAIGWLGPGVVRSLPPDYRESAAAFRELALGRLAGLRPGPTLTLGVGMGFDSNALMAPDDPTTIDLAPGAEDAWKSQLWGAATLATRNAGRVFFRLGGRAGRTFHLDEPADSIDATFFGASLAMQLYGLPAGRKAALEARVASGVTLLDGGPATLEESLFPFSENHTLSVGPSFWDLSDNAYSLRYSLSLLRFRELVRNGLSHSLSLGEEFRLRDNVSLAIAQAGTYVRAGDAYSRWGVSLGTILAWEIAYRFRARLRGTVQYEDYFFSQGYFSDEDARRDLPFVVRLEVEWDVGGGVSAGIFSSAGGRVSTIESLDYRKWETGMLATWSLGGVQ